MACSGSRSWRSATAKRSRGSRSPTGCGSASGSCTAAPTRRWRRCWPPRRRSSTSMATGSSAMGTSNDTSFLKAARGEWITARARARHRGRTTWVWEVDHTDGEERLVAVSRVTIAVRPRQREATRRRPRPPGRACAAICASAARPVTWSLAWMRARCQFDGPHAQMDASAISRLAWPRREQRQDLALAAAQLVRRRRAGLGRQRVPPRGDRAGRARSPWCQVLHQRGSVGRW